MVRLTAARLKQVQGVRSVFNPADEDRKYGFELLNCPEGSMEEAEKFGFNRRHTLMLDWSWIAERSNGMVVGPLWEKSTGAISEVHCHQALGLPVWSERDFFWCVNSGKSDWLLLMTAAPHVHAATQGVLMFTKARKQILDDIDTELSSAYDKHGAPKWGRHEFYGILLEEVEEMWDAIKADEPMERVYEEAVQEPWMVIRYFETGDRYDLRSHLLA